MNASNTTPKSDSKRTTKKKTIAEKQEKLRNNLWPDLDESELWHYNTSDGWLNIPRAFPLLLRIIDNLADKGKPVSATYLDLWCRTFNNSFVIASKPNEMAFYAGFTGERAVHTWRTRIRKLCDLGFIRAADGATGSEHYLLILDPFKIIKEYDKENKIQKSTMNALRERMIEIGASDLNDEKS